MKKIILFIHQSADLYGTDRVLLKLATELDCNKFHPIVFVPVDGPLIKKLQTVDFKCYFPKIAQLSRKTLTLQGLLELPINLIQNLHAFIE